MALVRKPNVQSERLGVGIQHNPEISDWFPFEQQDVDVLEILVDTVMGPLDSPYIVRPGAAQFLEDLSRKYKLLAHSNYGCEFGFDPLETSPAVRRHVAISKMIKSPWAVDHCFYGDGSWVDVWSSPLQFSRAEVKRIGDRARRLQDLYGVPLAHENAAYYLKCPGSDMSEPAFLTELVNYADTYLLLDLHNIYANSLNHPGYSTREFIDTIPLERILEVHLGGGSWNGGVYHDWHDNKVPEPVWDLLDDLLERCSPAAVVLEFQGRAHHPDTRVMNAAEDTEMIIQDINRAKAAWRRHLPAPSRLNATAG
jgi:uncharacterized protein (UPF0276 family)